MPFRSILKKNLTICSNQTGTKADMKALEFGASGKVVPELEITDLRSINLAMDRIKSGKVVVKLVIDLGDGKTI